MRCLGPIEEKCKEGMETLLSYDGGLRTYLLKMEYICADAKNGKCSAQLDYRIKKPKATAMIPKRLSIGYQLSMKLHSCFSSKH